jgi:subtilisin family serine protease
VPPPRSAGAHFRDSGPDGYGSSVLRAGIASKAAACLALLLAAPVARASIEARATPAAPPTPTTAFSSNRVIIEWAPESSRSDRMDARSDAEVEFKSDLGNRSFQLVQVRPGQATNDAVRELEADPAVEVAERDGYSAPNALPNDPLFGELWGLQNTGLGIDGFPSAVAGDDIDAPGAWERTVGTPSTVIADIDTGYRFEHPDLANVAWTNPGEAGGVDGVDDDGNGIIDDLHGADFVGANGEAPTMDGNPTDEDLLSGGHGVHTAGTMGAEGNNSTGITGVAQNVRIMALRVCSRFPSLGESRCPISSQIAAINYAREKGARVANMSLGGTSSSQAAVNAIAAAKETLFVISAGNDNQDNDSVHHYPCDYTPQTQASPPVPGAIDNIVCVAATDQADGRASFSDWGATSVDLGAPGTETLSTYPVRRFVDETFESDDFTTNWTATGADGGFSRANESPLASFGMTDSPGGPPAAGSTRESTSAAVAVPAGFSHCTLFQTRTVSPGGGTYNYEVLLDGSFVDGSSPNSSGRFFLPLNNALEGGGSLTLRFRYTAGESPTESNGVWLDDIELQCAEPVGQASGYAYLQGTSMAAPHVTGAAGLLFSFEPSATVTDVREALLSSVDAVPSLAGKTVSGGRLDVSKAIDVLAGEPPDEEAPAAPALTSTAPVSPANENHPKIIGTAEAGSAVRIYEGITCNGGSVATGTAAELSSPGIAVSVPDNFSTQFSATATDAALNTSPCSAPIEYTESTPEPADEEPPGAPLLTTTVPASPSSSNSPRIVGSAEADSAVRIYGNAACTGIVAAVGSAEELSSPGISVSVGNGSTAQFSATATDAALNASPCSAPISYTNSNPEETVVIVTPPSAIPPATLLSPPTLPLPLPCTVPKLAGKTLGQAKAALTAAGCTLGAASKPKAKRGQKAARVVVKSSSPSAGAKPTDGKVNLRLGPKPRLKKHHR